MIYGIGTDIVEISRIENIDKKFGLQFAKKILAPSEFDEYESSNNPAVFLAKRFAAKEAFLKALGIGLFREVALNQIQITHDKLGKPQIQCDSESQSFLKSLSIKNIHLSISDEKLYAVAMVVLES